PGAARRASRRARAAGQRAAHLFRVARRLRDRHPRDAAARLPLAALVGVWPEEGIAIVARRDERLLDRARADPADEVPHRAGLVVRSRRARAAERLLADDRARRLVVHVQVPGRVAELLAGLLDRRALLGEDRAGEPVRRAVVDELERLLPLPLRVDVGGHDRAEELVAEEPEV